MGENIDNFIEEFNTSPDIAVKLQMFNQREDVQQFIKDNLGLCHSLTLRSFMINEFHCSVRIWKEPHGGHQIER